MVTRGRGFLLSVLLASFLVMVAASQAETGDAKAEACDNPDFPKTTVGKIRMITPEELAK
jgi:hypothetical protein